MNTFKPNFTTIKPQLKQTVQMEANNLLPTFQSAGNIKLNHAKTSLFWVTAVMEKSVNLHMETFNSTLYVVEIFTKLKNAKTSGKKDFACMEYVVNSFIQNAQRDPVSKTIHNT